MHYLEKLSNMHLLPIKKTSSSLQRPLANTVCPKPTTIQRSIFLNAQRKKPWELKLERFNAYPPVLPELDKLPITNFPL